MSAGLYIRSKKHRIEMSSKLRKGKSIEECFLNKIKFSIKCWEWNGCRITDGYGMIGIYGKLKLAHRFSYELFNGKIYRKNEIHHLCENQVCVNPGHLQQLTKRKHLSLNKGKKYVCIKSKITRNSYSI